MAYFVYMVECVDGTYYTGTSNDVAKRVEAHNARTSGAKYTRGRLPVRLVYVETCADRGMALKREYVIKKMPRARKRALATSHEQDTKSFRMTPYLERIVAEARKEYAEGRSFGPFETAEEAIAFLDS